MIKTYIRFLFPGSFFTNSTEKEVQLRAISPDDVPANCFGYQFFDRQETVENGETLIGRNTNYSGTTYPGGVTYTVEQVKALDGDYRILISNMENNGHPLVVKTRWGNFQPFDPKEDSLA